MDARISGQRVDAVFAEAHVDVEITSLVVASGVPGQEVTVHIGGIGTAAGERVEVPNGMDLSFYKDRARGDKYCNLFRREWCFPRAVYWFR